MSNQIKIGLGILFLVIALSGYFFFAQGDKTSSGGNIFTNLFPKIDLGQEPKGGEEATTTPNTVEGRLVPISQSAVAGYTIVSTNEGKKVVRYIERGTGFIYDHDLSNGTSKKISNQTLNSVQNVLWGAGGNSFIAQSYAADILITTAYSLGGGGSFTFNRDLKLGDVNNDVLELQKSLNKDPQTQVSQTGLGSPGNETTRFGEATKKAVTKFQEKYAEDILVPQNLTKGNGVLDSTTRAKLNALTKPSGEVVEVTLAEKRLPVGLTQITISPDTSKIFYLLKERSGGVSGYTANIDGGNAKKIYTSLLGDLVPFWNDASTILLTTKPSGSVSGFLYTLNPLTNTSGNLLRNILGLTTQTSKNEKSILYSRKRAESGAPELSIYSRKNDVSEVLTFRTLPEKCVWGTTLLYCAVPGTLPPGLYPDDWYKGKVRFSDGIWSLNTSTKEQGLIAGTLPNVDAYALTLDDSEETLYFINRNDSTLWSLDLR